jgi:hypothetical protein
MVSMIEWHRRLHEVTGSMALRWGKASAGDLRAWAQELRAIAAAMEAASVAEAALEKAAEGAKASDNIPGWLLQDADS